MLTLLVVATVLYYWPQAHEPPVTRPAPAAWVPLAAGVEWRQSDGLTVVRLSENAALDVLSGDRRTAAEWLRTSRAVAAINAGMFQTDGRSAGHLHCGKRVNQAAWNAQYQSVLVFRPRVKGLPQYTVVDLDQLGARETIAKYDCAVQNLRLIRAPGESVWRAAPRKWAESALALDRDGRLLLVFSKTPLSMERFISMLLESDLEIVRAMHLDGGPEASLSLAPRSGCTRPEVEDIAPKGAQEPEGGYDFHAGDSAVGLPNVLVVSGTSR